MSEPVVFEAWSAQVISNAKLCRYMGTEHVVIRDEPEARDCAEINTDRGFPTIPVRVRVTVEVIEPDDGPQEAA
jgi:hypothetical protein